MYFKQLNLLTMKKILVLLALLVSGSCFGQVPADSLITIKEGGEFSLKQSAILREEFSKIDIFKNIKEMKNFSITEDDILDKKFIQGEGVDEDGNYVVFRTAVEIKRLENGDSQFAPQLPNEGESCTGVNCSKCAFASGGGCTCKKEGSLIGEPSYCNHTISAE
jgi:hypothetical protein